MRVSCGFAILVATVSFCSVAYSQDTNLTWTNATQNVDGTDIPPTGPDALASTTIEWSRCDPETSMVQVPFEIEVVTPDITEKTITTGSGTFCFRAKHTNEAGASSDFTPVVVKVINAIPMPPGDFVVSALTVYSVQKLNDGFLLLAIGKVPLGTPCDRTQTVNGKYVVPADEVIWDTANRAPVVVADCV